MPDFFEIWQLKRKDSTAILRFMGTHYLAEHDLTVDLANYNHVYTDSLTEETTLEDLYTRFNITRPKDFKGHSMSVSDIVILYQNGEATPYYCDTVGFADVSDFITPDDIQKAKQNQISLNPHGLKVEGQPGTWAACVSVEVEGQEFIVMANAQNPNASNNLIVSTDGQLVAVIAGKSPTNQDMQKIKLFLHPELRHLQVKPSIRNRLKAAQEGKKNMDDTSRDTIQQKSNEVDF